MILTFHTYGSVLDTLAIASWIDKHMFHMISTLLLQLSNSIYLLVAAGGWLSPRRSWPGFGVRFLKLHLISYYYSRAFGFSVDTTLTSRLSTSYDLDLAPRGSQAARRVQDSLSNSDLRAHGSGVDLRAGYAPSLSGPMHGLVASLPQQFWPLCIADSAELRLLRSGDGC